nr:MAG TPA: hyaluronidase [Caudoviricetes sp.]
MAQNESTNTTIISRIMSKIDTAANWDANNPVLLKGEIVPVIVPDSEGNTAYVVFKVGDGVSNYATLPFTSANAWDVYDWAKAATKPTYDYSEIKNTPTIPSAPTIDQKYSATSKNAQSGVAVAEALALKVDKVDGKTLTSNDFTSALLSKLNGIAEGANKYVHPTHTAHSTSGLYKITVDALGHVTSATAVTKEDITKLGIPAITVDTAMSTTSTNPVQNKVVNTALSNKQDKFADVTNPGICKVTMSNSGQTYFCNGASDSGIYFDTSIRLLQGKGIKNDDDLVHKKYVDTEVANNKVTVDSEMSSTSTNPVQNKVVKAEIDSKALNVTDTGSGNLSISSLGYSPVTTNSVYISDFTDTDTASVDESSDDVSAQFNGSDSPSAIATADSGSNITLKSLYFKDLNVTYKIPDAVTVDTALSSSSKHPVENQVITTALAGKTDLSASGASSLINKLSTGNSTPSDTDLFISQYVGGGTTNTNYYRRPISTLNTYIKSKADTTPTSGSANLVTSGAVYTALAGKASSTHTHTLNQVTASAFNTTGSVDYISRSLVPYISGTKFYGMPAAAITVEYSRDAGATWIDYGLDNGAKMRIFDHSGGVNLYLGRASTKADNSINNMLRITIDATKSDGRYLSTDSMFTWMSSNGNTTYVTLEVASYNAPTTFKTIVNNAPINGWSGPNMSHYGMITFGGSTAGSTSPNNQFYRLTYKQTAINSNYSSALISDIRFFGSTLWGGGTTISTNMLKQGAPYSVRLDSDGQAGTVRFSKLGAAFGNDTAADGKYSLAGGINAIVNHEGSIAYGRDLNTSAQYQAVFGKYNATSSTALFQVGNGTSTSSRKTAFNVFTDGHAEVQTQGTTNNSVVIKSTVDAKQDKFATVTTADTIQTVKIGDNLSIVTSPNFGYSQIRSSKILVLSGEDSTTSYVSLRKSKLESSCDFDATQGYLRVRDNPLADDFAVNKKYVTTAVSNKLDADTDNYNIAYDTTSEAIKITFKN